MMSSPKHRLRRSCAFCRARKIKCSNEAICEACRRQGADCIYDFETTRSKASSSNGNQDRVTPPGSHISLSSYPTAATGIPGSCDSFSQENEPENVAAALEHSFLSSFASQSHVFQSKIHSLSAPDTPELSPMASTGSLNTNTPTQTRLDSTDSDILSVIPQDLVSIVANQFGLLGCSSGENEQAQFFLEELASDEARTMFDENTYSPSDPSPLSELSQRQQTQLIDVWYSTHPLSFIISKTLFLRELRDGVQDDVLLAIILGEASIRTGHRFRGRSLLSWATAQLRSLPLWRNKLPRNGGVATDESTPVFSGMSTRIFHGICTAQALVLLGWHNLTSASARRAICYLRLASAISADLKEQISTAADPKASSRINGIDVFDVEKELIDHLHWAAFAICLWAFVQTGDDQLAPSLSASQSSILVPASEDLSAIIRLDKISENFNTLHAQTDAIRVIWPLAHIASVVSKICASYPADFGNAAYGVKAPVMQPSSLRDRFPSSDMGGVDLEITGILSISIAHMNHEINDSLLSGNIVLVAYHTLYVHFLFPARKEDGYDPDTIDQFCSSAQEVLKSLRFMDETCRNPKTEGSLWPLLPRMLTLALETCSRALGFIQQQEYIEEADARAVESLAKKLYESSKSVLLAQSGAIRLARKHLKAFLCALDPDGGQQFFPPSTQGAVIPTIPLALGHITPEVLSQSSTEFDAFMSGHSLSTTALLDSSSPHRHGPASMSSASPSNSEHLSTASTATFDFATAIYSAQERSGKASPMVPPISIPPLHRPVVMNTSSMAAGLDEMLSPADVFKSSWQPMGTDDLFDDARMMNYDTSRLSPEETSAVTGASVTDASDAALVPRGASWFPRLPPGIMMDLDMASILPLDEVPSSNSDGPSDEAWYMNAMTM